MGVTFMGRIKWAAALLGLGLALAPLTGACGPNAAAPAPHKTGATQGVRKAGRVTAGSTKRAKHTVKRVSKGAHRALKTADKKAMKAGKKVKRTMTGARHGRAKRSGGKSGGSKNGKNSDHRVKRQAGAVRGSAAARAGAGLRKRAGRPAAGRALYVRECASCHGTRGQGTGKGSPLGADNVVAGYRNLPALRVYIAHNMPSTAPGRLSPNEVKRVAAYVWKIAGGA